MNDETVYEVTGSSADEDEFQASTQHGGSMALTAPTKREFDRDELDLIKRTVAAGTSDDEFRLFIKVCNLTELNPFTHQIYAIMRRQNEGGQWVNKMTIQTGIDGYLSIAARTHEFVGMDDVAFDTEEGNHPNWARVTVYRLVRGQRAAFTATVRWREYVQVNRDGNPTSMWARMGWTMLGKCARALALRLAFPYELSGVYTDDEMAQADNPPVAYVDSARPQQQTLDATQTIRTSSDLNWIPERDPAIKKALNALGFTRAIEQHDYIASLRTFFAKEDREWTKGGVMEHMREQYKENQAQARRAQASGPSIVDADSEPSSEPAPDYDLSELGTGPGVH